MRPFLRHHFRGSARFFFTGLRLPSRRDLGLRVGLGGLGVELLEAGTPALQTLSLDFKASFSAWCFVRIEGIDPCSNKILYNLLSKSLLKGSAELSKYLCDPYKARNGPCSPRLLAIALSVTLSGGALC